MSDDRDMLRDDLIAKCEALGDQLRDNIKLRHEWQQLEKQSSVRLEIARRALYEVARLGCPGDEEACPGNSEQCHACIARVALGRIV